MDSHDVTFLFYCPLNDGAFTWAAAEGARTTLGAGKSYFFRSSSMADRPTVAECTLDLLYNKVW